MDERESLNHTKWECKYHVVFIPKCRRKTLYKELRQPQYFFQHLDRHSLRTRFPSPPVK